MGTKWRKLNCAKFKLVLLVVVFRPRSVKWAGHAEIGNGEGYRNVWLGKPQASGWQAQAWTDYE
jgi:hypothetical protein